MKKNLGLRKSWWRWGCGSNKKDEQMDGHEVGIEIGLLEKALVQFTASIPLTLFVSTSGLKKEFKAKREIDPVFPCHGPPPRKISWHEVWGGVIHHDPLKKLPTCRWCCMLCEFFLPTRIYHHKTQKEILQPYFVKVLLWGVVFVLQRNGDIQGERH